MKKSNYIRPLKSGFTLIEVMVVVVILAIMAAIIVPRVMQRPLQAQIVRAKQDVIAIENALELYKLDNGIYPTQDQGLGALVKLPTAQPVPQNWESGGYLHQLPKDPWGHPYHYINPGKHGDVDIYSYGPSNQPDGTGTNATIANWNVSEKSAA